MATSASSYIPYPTQSPADTPPPGIEANLVDPPNQQYLAILTVGICLPLATIVVLVRMYVSAFINRTFKWDDAFVFVSWLGFIGYSFVMVYLNEYGSLTDVWNLTYGTYTTWGYFINIEMLMYSALIFCAKLSVLLLYLRIFVPARTTKTWVYWAIVLTITFNSMYYVANDLIVAFACNPREKIWDRKRPGSCVRVYPVIIGSTAVNVLSEVLVVLIPVVVIFRLHLSFRKRLEIMAVFAFNFVGLGAGVYRLIFSINNAADPNQSMILTKIGLWTFGEITSCFLASCVPMFPPLVRHVWGKAFGAPEMSGTAGNDTDNRTHQYMTPLYSRWSRDSQTSLRSRVRPGLWESSPRSAARNNTPVTDRDHRLVHNGVPNPDAHGRTDSDSTLYGAPMHSWLDIRESRVTVTPETPRSHWNYPLSPLPSVHTASTRIEPPFRPSRASSGRSSFNYSRGGRYVP